MAAIDPQVYEQAGSTFNVDPLLLRAMSGVESNENTAAVGPLTRYGNARGNMQFIDETAKRYGVANPHEPVQAVFGAASYLSDLLNKHKGDVGSALQEYNGATGDASQVYAKAVAVRYRALQAAAAKDEKKPKGEAASPSDALTDVQRFMTSPTPAKPASAAAPEPPATDALSDVDRFMATPAPVEPGKTAPGAAPTLGDTVASYIPESVQKFGAGVVQGARDVGQTIAGWERQANEAVPALAAIDRFTGTDPGRAENLLAGQTKAFEKEHGDSTAASLGRIGGDVGLTTAMLPVGAAGRGAATVGRAVAPWAANLLRYVTEGAVAGGGTSALTSGPSGENPLTAAKEGAVMGGALGGAMPVVRAGIGAISGTTGRSLRAIADRLGIDITTGQQLGGIVGRIEDASTILPFSGAAAKASQQNGQIAQVIAREAGIPGPVQQLTTPMLNTAERRIGGAIDNAARRIDVPLDNTLTTELGRIEAAAKVPGATAPEANATRTLIDRILTMSGPGNNMAGADFQRFIQRGGELDSAINNSNPEIARAGRAIREALFDSAERSGSTGVADLRNARYQYKVVQTVRDAIDKSVSGSESMSQAKLAQLIRREFDMSRTGPGNNMQDLARLLDGIKPLRSSGTAERLGTYGMLLGGGGLWAYSPEQMEDLMLRYGPQAAATLLAGRASRFGPGLGVQVPAAVAGAANPLAPRVAGPLYRPPPSDNALAQP